MADLVAGDETLLRVKCRDRSRQPLSLTGNVVDFTWRINGGAKTTAQMSIVDTTGGIAEYRFDPGQISAGTLSGEVRVQDANSHKVRAVKRVFLTVREAMS